MKNLKLTFMSALMMVFVSIPAMAQKTEKVIAVVNKADWCSTCVKNEERAQTAFMNANKDGDVLFVVNNVTDDDTKAKSLVILEKAGINKDAMAKLKSTGVVYFFNVETKEYISSVSLKKKDAELVSAMNKALVQ